MAAYPRAPFTPPRARSNKGARIVRGQPWPATMGCTQPMLAHRLNGFSARSSKHKQTQLGRSIFLPPPPPSPFLEKYRLFLVSSFPTGSLCLLQKGGKH